MVDPDEVAPWRLRLAACLHVLRELDSAVEELNSVLEVQGRSRGGCAARSGPDRGFLDIAAVQPDKSWQAQLEDALRTCRSFVPMLSPTHTSTIPTAERSGQCSGFGYTSA
jgi:hypothetical protein